MIAGSRKGARRRPDPSRSCREKNFPTIPPPGGRLKGQFLFPEAFGGFDFVASGFAGGCPGEGNTILSG